MDQETCDYIYTQKANADGTVDIELFGKYAGWVAVAFNRDALMVSP